MEKNDRKPHYCMKVDTFSQLPFKRLATPVKETTIRLFGMECTSDQTQTLHESKSSARKLPGGENNNSVEEFVCTFCFKTFATPQGLGGHQNAHKRERQNVKRAQFQRAMALNTIHEGHVCELLNYQIHGATTAPTLSPYSSLGHQGALSEKPLTGTPLAMWRTQGYSHDRMFMPSHSQSSFQGGERSISSSVKSSGSGGPNLFHSKTTRQDVSLDLHL